MIKKLLFFLFFLTLLIPVFSIFSGSAYADSRWTKDCAISYDPSIVTKDVPSIKVTIDTQGQAVGPNYNLDLWQAGAGPLPGHWVAQSETLSPDANGKITIERKDLLSWLDESGKEIRVNLVNSNDRGFFNDNFKCPNELIIPVNTNDLGTNLCTFNFHDTTYGKDPTGTNSAGFDPKQYMLPGHNINASVTCPSSNPNSFICKDGGQPAQVFIKNNDGAIINSYPTTVAGLKAGQPIDPLEQGLYLFDVQVPIPVPGISNTDTGKFYECSKQFRISVDGGGSGCSTDNDCLNDPNGRYCLPDSSGSLSCQEPKHRLAINPCITKGNEYICQTAIGAIGTSAGGFAQGVLQIFLGLAGIILLFTIILNGYKFMTSQGDPEKVKEARESITAAVAGLLVIIFSIVLLQLITVDILHLPGFTP